MEHLKKQPKNQRVECNVKDLYYTVHKPKKKETPKRRNDGVCAQLGGSFILFGVYKACGKKP